MYESNRAESLERLTELIKDIRVAMFVTRSGDGTLRSRPMAAQEAPFDGTRWFFAAGQSATVSDLAQAPEVVLAYADLGGNRYVSLSGRAELVRDPDKAKELWSPLYREWFPKGLEDPDLALLKVVVSRAEYWDSPGTLGTVGKILAEFSGEMPTVTERPEQLHGTVRFS
jgi:general stress protein 26